LQEEIQENNKKIQLLKEELLRKISDLTRETIAAEKVDSKLKELKTEFSKSVELMVAKSKEELLGKITTYVNDIKNLEKKYDTISSSKSVDSKDVFEKLKQSQEEMQKNFDLLVSKCREELNVKVTLAETKAQKIKEDLMTKTATNASDIKTLGSTYTFLKKDKS
jgi:hypothetical protein